MQRIKTMAQAALLAGLVGSGCIDRPIEPIEPRTTSTIHETLTQRRVDKIDLLLSIDDSGSMADKQKILAVAVPSLVESLVNPDCIDDQGNTVSVAAGQKCPAGHVREFTPVDDIHIGVISTSLGARGGTLCGSANPADEADAELLHADDGGNDVATFDGQGFLAWQPTSAGTAPGLYKDAAVLGADLEKIVRGVGQQGCGLEAQLESWYRFLVDPDPYLTITNDGKGGPNALSGTDSELLAQRVAFLRPDSLVAIVMLSDENDCSFRAEGQGYWTGGRITGLKARQECASDPLGPCCAPCGEKVAETCPADPTCADPAPADNDLVNVTCFDQKRRFGADLLYPVERYVAGLTEAQISDRHGNVVDNPLFVSGGMRRDRDRVFFTGIVGVPWQLIARDPMNLRQGLKSAAELDAHWTWDVILGDPGQNVPPSDPHMLESIHPRPAMPPTSAAPNADPISGHEFEPRTDLLWGDLQFACTFDLLAPIDCALDPASCETGSQGGLFAPDCNPAQYTDNPLCQDAQGQYHTDRQFRAKAYPGLRHLSVLKGIGDQGIVGSICPAQLSRKDDPDYGYLPTIEALVERLKQELRDPCLSRSLTPDANKQVSCVILEGRKLEQGQACDCAHAAGRSTVLPGHQQAVQAALAEPSTAPLGLDCFCEIDQLAGEELRVCQQELVPEMNGETVDGWCYIDAMTFPRTGNDALVAHCSETERRTLRFVGEAEPVIGSTVFISCHESSE